MLFLDRVRVCGRGEVASCISTIKMWKNKNCERAREQRKKEM